MAGDWFPDSIDWNFPELEPEGQTKRVAPVRVRAHSTRPAFITHVERHIHWVIGVFGLTVLAIAIDAYPSPF